MKPCLEIGMAKVKKLKVAPEADPAVAQSPFPLLNGKHDIGPAVIEVIRELTEKTLKKEIAAHAEAYVVRTLSRVDCTALLRECLIQELKSFLSRVNMAGMDAQKFIQEETLKVVREFFGENHDRRPTT